MIKLTRIFGVFVVALSLLSCGQSMSPADELKEQLQGFWVGNSSVGIDFRSYAEFVGNKLIITQVITKNIGEDGLFGYGIAAPSEEKSIFDFETIDGTRFQVTSVSSLSSPKVVTLNRETKSFKIENITNPSEIAKDFIRKIYKDSSPDATTTFRKALNLTLNDLRGNWRAEPLEGVTGEEYLPDFQTLEIGDKQVLHRRLDINRENKLYSYNEDLLNLKSGFILSGAITGSFLRSPVRDFMKLSNQMWVTDFDQDILQVLTFYDLYRLDHPNADSIVYPCCVHTFKRVNQADLDIPPEYEKTDDMLFEIAIREDAKKLAEQERKKKLEQEMKRQEERKAEENRRKRAAEKRKKIAEERRQIIAKEKAELKEISEGIGKDFCRTIVENNNVVSKESKDPLAFKTISKYQTVVEQMCASSTCYENIMEARKIKSLEGTEAALQSLGVVERSPKVCDSSFDIFLLSNIKRGWERSLEPNYEEPKFEAAKLERISRDDDFIPVYIPQPQYPRRAQTRGVEGYAVVEVIITTTGGVRGPKVIEEFPEGWGFGRAALKAANKLKYNPRVVDGAGQEVPGVLYKFSFAMAR